MFSEVELSKLEVLWTIS